MHSLLILPACHILPSIASKSKNCRDNIVDTERSSGSSNGQCDVNELAFADVKEDCCEEEPVKMVPPVMRFVEEFHSL